MRVLPVVLLVFAAGCGGEVLNPVPGLSSSSASSTTSSSTGPMPSTAAIRFFTDAEVTRTFAPEQVSVRLTGLEPGADVTVRATMPGFESHATFLVGDDGEVDAATQAPSAGTYEGADPDGLFWSMVAAGELPAEPDIDVVFKAEVGGSVVAEATLERYSMADDLIETPVTDDGLVGVFVTPAGPGPHPALVTFGGSEGGLRSGQGLARFYASLGYSCLGVAYFAEAGLPSSLTQIPLEYLGKALVWLQNRPEVAPDKIGVLGGSRGGELALLLGANFADVKAVVAQAPSGVVWPAWSNGQGVVSSWTLAGQDLPFIPPTNAQPTVTQDDQGHDVMHYTPAFNAMLDDATAAELEAASAKVEDTMAPILMIGGDDDQIWPSCRLAQIAMDRLDAAGHGASFADDFQCYPDAGHGFGSPGYPTTGSSVVQHPVSKEWIALGGTPAGIAHANRESFERKRAFLAAALQ